MLHIILFSGGRPRFLGTEGGAASAAAPGRRRLMAHDNYDDNRDDNNGPLADNDNDNCPLL